MTMYMSVTMDDCKSTEWTYSMQYMGRIVRICVPEPLEAMSVTQRESVIMDMVTESFNNQREAKLLQKPEEAVDEWANNVAPRQMDEDDYENDLSDVSTQELMDEINERLGEDPDQE